MKPLTFDHGMQLTASVGGAASVVAKWWSPEISPPVEIRINDFHRTFCSQRLCIIGIGSLRVGTMAVRPDQKSLVDSFAVVDII